MIFLSITAILFDRLIIAQALAEEMAILTSDRMFKKYSVDLVWCGK